MLRPDPAVFPTVMREQAALQLRIKLLPELEQLNGSVDTISQVISLANETVMLINFLPLVQLPTLPEKRWQSPSSRLSALEDNARVLVDLLMQPKSSEFMVRDSEIRQHVQLLKSILQKLKESLVKTKVELSTVLAKIENVRAKITHWIRRLLMRSFLVMFWVAGGQIYLLEHF
jgi:hypothetical protein